ncbi:unnamed protein product [Polarella glacialis]|uniref:RING-CH-type domain-containing protein n=1 Tax=Polarella glacialis TaxID=89957 RepID=A0A813JY79_POLGL|nr:unnamed protein product [Polarella glacialis]
MALPGSESAGPDSLSEELQCRYCLLAGGGTDAEKGEHRLVSPCSCVGGQRWVHLRCLRRWQRSVLTSQAPHLPPEADDIRATKCNVCLQPFAFPPQSRHEMLRDSCGSDLADLIRPSSLILTSPRLSQELQASLRAGQTRRTISDFVHWCRSAFLIHQCLNADHENIFFGRLAEIHPICAAGHPDVYMLFTMQASGNAVSLVFNEVARSLADRIRSLDRDSLGRLACYAISLKTHVENHVENVGQQLLDAALVRCSERQHQEKRAARGCGASSKRRRRRRSTRLPAPLRAETADAPTAIPKEGPMPQTKFVLRQALKLQRPVIVCINKVDKPASRPDWVLDTTFDLFASLGASDEICDFPVVYASGFHGVASTEGPDKLVKDLKPLLDLILKKCPCPQVDEDAPLQMLVSNLDYDDHIGRISIGRVRSGSLKVGQEVGFMYGESGEMRKARVSKLWQSQNNDKSPIDLITAGDICAFSGMNDVTISDTVVAIADPRPLPPIVVEEPTVVMEFGVNKSPMAAQLKESTKLTAAMIKNLEPGFTSETSRVKGRGTLQLGILMENMRREGFEIMIGPPEVIYRNDPETGKKQEPYEECAIEVPVVHQGLVLEEMVKKGGNMKTMESGAIPGTVVLVFEIPTRNMIGMLGKFQQKTSGSAVVTSQFSHWGEFLGGQQKLRDHGSIVSTAEGKATFYAILNGQGRGKYFIEPTEAVYAGMIVGIHNKDNDIEVNITKEKNVTNITPGPIRLCKRPGFKAGKQKTEPLK